MKENNKQTQVWSSEFGKEYTDRNIMSMEEMDLMYKKQYGISRIDMNTRFLDGLDRNIRVLEVGSNIGLQLLFLQKMGFSNLYGIEISPYAVELSKSKTKGINILWGNALDIPFKNNWFDLVFTSGLLIHIDPEELPIVLEEIYRCSNSYIWGFEYFAKEYTQVKYRQPKETTGLLWKADFPQIFLKQFDNLKAIKIELFKYLNSENIDVMFLLEKK